MDLPFCCSVYLGNTYSLLYYNDRLLQKLLDIKLLVKKTIFQNKIDIRPKKQVSGFWSSGGFKIGALFVVGNLVFICQHYTFTQLYALTKFPICKVW